MFTHVRSHYGRRRYYCGCRPEQKILARSGQSNTRQVFAEQHLSTEKYFFLIIQGMVSIMTDGKRPETDVAQRRWGSVPW